MSRAPWILLVSLLAALPPAAPLRAANFTVNSTADRTDAASGDGVCDTGNQVDGQPECTLRAAIQQANANADLDVVFLPAGRFVLTIPGDGEGDAPSASNAAVGDLDIERSLTLLGASARETIVDANGVGRALHVPFVGASNGIAVDVSGVTLTGGSVPETVGGGLLFEADGATMVLSDSTVSGNEASQGAGVNNGSPSGFGGTLTIRRSTISSNRTLDGGQGGGIQNLEPLVLENVTVSRNSAQFGGGIMQFSGALTITNSTIAGNKAEQPGGAIFVNSGAPSLTNTLLAKNKSRSKAQNNCSGAVVSLGNNLEEGTSCGLAQPGDLSGVKAKLGGLKDNGGPTNTHALGKGSPAIDNGTNIGCPAQDQRGVARPLDGNLDSLAFCDIGAFEK